MTFTDKSAKWNCSSLCKSLVLSGSCRARGFSGTSIFMNNYWQQCLLQNSFQIQITEGFGVWCWFLSPQMPIIYVPPTAQCRKSNAIFLPLKPRVSYISVRCLKAESPFGTAGRWFPSKYLKKVRQIHKHINKNSCHSICTMNEDNIKSVTNEIIFD